MADRILKINELIAHELGMLFERELALKAGVFITIAKVDTTRDLRYTRVFVSVFPESETHYAIRTLDHERKMLQKELHQKLVMKQKPNVSFHLNTSEREADKIEKILKIIKDEGENA